MDEEAFEALTGTLVKLCPEERREWLSGRLLHGNEVTLGLRIKSIIEPFKEQFGTSKERSKLIRSIVDTRNYLTHYDNSLEAAAATGVALWLLCLKMEAVFQLHLLQVLGFTEAEIGSVLENSKELQQKLKA
jgi:hypothetical protein